MCEVCPRDPNADWLELGAPPDSGREGTLGGLEGIKDATVPNSHRRNMWLVFRHVHCEIGTYHTVVSCFSIDTLAALVETSAH